MINARACVAASIITLCSAVTWGWQSVPPGVIRLAFSDGPNLADGSIQYQVLAGSGSYGSVTATTRDRRQYEFPGWSAAGFKAIAYIPGYRFVLIDDPVGSGRRTSPIQIDLQPLGTVRMVGRISDLDTPPSSSVVVNYLAPWGHEFFGKIDGFISTFRVATSPLAATGAFDLRVPDFVNDPAVGVRFVSGSMRERGWFQLHVVDAAGHVSLLEDSSSPRTFVRVAVAPDYPQPITVRPLTR